MFQPFSITATGSALIQEDGTQVHDILGIFFLNLRLSNQKLVLHTTDTDSIRSCLLVCLLLETTPNHCQFLLEHK